ncbi:hypothetical protein BSZ07_38145 [Streptomyces sp. M1013]|nr:hypothetical protein BSZ07_38145 [Streptomyces sp. M1013]
MTVVTVEALLEKTISGARYKDLAPKYGVDWKTLQTQANRWLNRGARAEAMKVSADVNRDPAASEPAVHRFDVFAPHERACWRASAYRCSTGRGAPARRGSPCAPDAAMTIN